MKNYLLLALIFTLGCASGAAGLLRLQDRELLVHPDQPGLAYPFKETICVDNPNRITRVWRKKNCHQEHKIDFYDFNDKAVRDDLIKAGFTCKSAMRFKY
jgi:hypothetical protein